MSESMEQFWLDLEYTDLAMHIGATWWFPLLESIHVLAAVIVLGFILMVDLRLLGLAATRYPAALLIRQQTPWSVVAFVVAVVTGAGMFITNALSYATNPAMQIKLVLLVLAGLNMLLFHWLNRSGQVIDATKPSITARISGLSSLIIWVGVMLAGRWIGHT